MNRYLLVGLLILPLCALAQWHVRMGGLPPSWPFQTVALADSGTAWVAGGGKLWRSTNLGTTWLPISIPARYGYPGVLAAITRTSLVYGTDWGKIVRTTDAGASWEAVFDDSSVTPFINDLTMFDSLNGCAIGDPSDSSKHPGLFKTTDGGGASWQVVTNDLPVGDIQSRGRTSFVRPDLAWTKVMNDGIYKSTDGGQSWKRIYAGLAPHDLFFLNDSVGFFTSVMFPIGLYKSSNGGVTWSQKFFGQHFIWVRWAPAGKVIWGGNDTLFVSTNTGETWQPLLQSRGQGGCGSLADAAFLTDDVGLVIGPCLVLGMSQDPDFVRLPPEGDIPRLLLLQNYPNPFNPSTVIRYGVAGARGWGLGTSRVRLVVYDLLGREVAVLVNENKAPGNYEVTFDASGLASGVYFYRLTAGAFVSCKKLILAR